jgi:FkbH-like protein
MYEPEVNWKTESIDALPPEVRARFSEHKDLITERTVLPWGEHCTECNWPTCYTTCELYTPREDGACRLFVDGMVRIDIGGAVIPYLLKIRFKRWGKLWCPGNLQLHPRHAALRKEKTSILLGAAARSLPLPAGLRRRVLGKVGSGRRWVAKRAAPGGGPPDSFLLECYNPNPHRIDLTFSVKYRQNEVPELYQIGGGDLYQRLVSVEPGFRRERIPVVEIRQRVDLNKPFNVEIVPNDAEDTVLYFGLLEFVREAPIAEKSPGGSPKWKCIVWDLDNTLWKGVLVEDGPEKLEVDPGVVEVIRETDRRGILHSIASKNNPEDALAVLRAHGLEEYFLCPQIGWHPKSRSVADIAQLLNIGLNTVAFVDDQPFEREEVKQAHPEVTTLDVTDYRGIPKREECRVPVTPESRRRRLMYRQQESRKAALTGYQGDYMSFLRACDIRLEIASLADENLERVYELAQRTNQMNFSGNRYPRSQLCELMKSRDHETFVLSCTDKFGSYGIVGFALVERREPRLLDLMFSCRVQSKRVEHAFLTFLLKRFVGEEGRDLFADYRRTPKNAASGQVFEEMGFQTVGEVGGGTSLVFPGSKPIPDDGIISVRDASEQPASR